ncbi:MAG: 23S rRNA (adenine(2503)-C(2))-methyltransferase RlmN [Candidatus Fermentibacteraceae bacterium]|nr:23S rRNA (adenine(2503)-C(2))-methyltransferase RlmN [Candidatus Fermentibacteraceae bacterium]
MIRILGMKFSDLETWLVDELHQKPFRAKQLFTWLHHRRATSFDEMTDLSLKFRSILKSSSVITHPEQTDSIASEDGTVKFLLSLPSGPAETVLIPEPPRFTVCLSTQYGCRMGCKFCMTGQAGFHGNMTTDEIVSQLYTVAANSENRVSNVVLMGMGEPMDNWDAVRNALEIISDDRGICIGQRKITVSTVGIPGGIRKLVDMGKQYGLAVSLHSAVQETREMLVPSAKAISLSQLKRDMLEYTGTTGRRVTLEYCLIEGANDSLKEAAALADYSKDIPCKINLLVYNAVPDLEWRQPSEQTTQKFIDYLYPRCQAVTLRRSRGGEVAGACGQLGASILKK